MKVSFYLYDKKYGLVTNEAFDRYYKAENYLYEESYKNTARESSWEDYKEDFLIIPHIIESEDSND